MAIVEMSKIRLIGLSYHKERLLNALHKTGLVELKNTGELQDTSSFSDEKSISQAQEKYERAKSAVDFFEERIAMSEKKEYYPKEIKDSLGNFFVSYDEFMSASGNEVELNYVIEKTEDYRRRLLNARSEKVRLSNLRSALMPYKNFPCKFSDFTDTKKTRKFLGLIKTEKIKGLSEYLNDYPFTDFVVYDGVGDDCVLFVISYVEDAETIAGKLGEEGFSACQFDFDMTASEKIRETDEKIAELDAYEEVITKKTCGRAGNLRNLKILTDYYKFQLEKARDAEKFRCTEKTFVLDGYLPKDAETQVKNALYNVSNAVFIEYSAPDENDTPPTLTKNDPIVRQTEFVTDMYSSPNYKEIDPNRVVFFFFMLFMGIIVADVGYGALMILFGIFLASKQKVDNGKRRLWNVIAIGGAFSIIFGLLFDSFFGVAVIGRSVIPSPTPDLVTGEINIETVMTLLLACLGLGVLQIAVGYFCKALNCFKNGKIVDGLLDGLVWVLFFVGLVFASFNFITAYLGITVAVGIKEFFGKTETVGLIVVIATVALSALTAGRHEKGFGKFSKGFGAVYGLISIMSDILSYARLFGLMLSGMIIAQTFNYKLGLPLIAGGGVGVVLGPIVIVAGHLFNLAMGVLGAYIHDSRLQYIEFFGKFYTGEGEKFKPLGADTDYVYVMR